MQAHDFLQWQFDRLQDDEVLELRAIRIEPRDTKNATTTDLEYARAFCDYYDAQGYNVYYGINPRAKGTRYGRKADLTRGWCVWADLDAKDYEGGKEEARRRLEAFALPPTALIDSGGGYQALWRLADPVPPAGLPELEHVVAALAGFLESDTSVCDATRILRVPGTHNHKPVYTGKPQVALVFAGDETYRFAEFTDLFPAPEPQPAAPTAPSTPPGEDEFATLASALAAIDPWGLTYEEWNRCLMAVHSAFPGEDGLALAEGWAQGQQGEVAQKWRSYRGSGTSVATIFHFAKAAGWVVPAPAYGEFIWEPPDPKADAAGPQPTPPPTTLRFLPLAEFLMADFPRPEWLVDQLLMTASTSLLVAKPKVGKSTLAANLAFAVASGQKFLNREVRQGATLVLSLDQEPGPMQAQYDALVADLLAPGGSLPPLAIHAQYEVGHDLFPQIAQILRATRPALLIVDTLTKLVPIKDGNSYSEVPLALAPYTALATETGTHICFLHHAHKGVADGADVTMGSVGFTGAVGTIMVLKKDPATGLITFEATQRWAAEIPETVIDFHPISRAVSVRGAKDAATRDEIKRRLLALLAVRGELTEQEIKTELAPLPELPVGLALRDLVETARLRRIEGKPHRYAAYRWDRPQEPGDTQLELVP